MCIRDSFRGRGEEERWKDFWFGKDAITLYFVGKDNIPFHTIILPALLLATGDGYNLPWNVASTEFLLFGGQKFSKSRRVGVWIDEALRLFPADYWRYSLLSMRPEAKDTNFSWKMFREKINSDLNDTLGNFIHRTLTFINRYFDGAVPKPSELDRYDKRVLRSALRRVEKTGKDLENLKLQSALQAVIGLSHLGNRYLNRKEPWNAIKTDPKTAANTLYVAVQIIKALAITLEPFIPFTAERLWGLLNLSGTIHEQRWNEATIAIPPGHKMNKPIPLFQKIEWTEDALKAELERARSSPQTTPLQEPS